MNIRRVEKEDMAVVHGLIKELATYEKAADQVETTVESMIKDGFGDQPLFECYVAETDTGIVGIALYYWRYSTWKGRCLYLEDIIVRENHRGKGIGKALFEKLYEIARDHECALITWQVLDWNEPAILFYKNFGASFDPEWINCRVTREQFGGG